MADIVYDDVVKLAEKLTPDEQVALAEHLIELRRDLQALNEMRKAAIRNELIELARHRPLTNEERKTLFHMSISSDPVFFESDRREDWYNDDGR